MGTAKEPGLRVISYQFIRPARTTQITHIQETSSVGKDNENVFPVLAAKPWVSMATRWLAQWPLL